MKILIWPGMYEISKYIRCTYKRKKAFFFLLIFSSPIILVPNHSLSKQKMVLLGYMHMDYTNHPEHAISLSSLLKHRK